MLFLCYYSLELTLILLETVLTCLCIEYDWDNYYFLSYIAKCHLHWLLLFLPPPVSLACFFWLTISLALYLVLPRRLWSYVDEVTCEIGDIWWCLMWYNACLELKICVHSLHGSIFTLKIDLKTLLCVCLKSFVLLFPMFHVGMLEGKHLYRLGRVS